MSQPTAAMTEADANKIIACLSTPRMTTYQQVVTHKPQNEQTLAALALYRWNVEVSAAFMAPIHLCEVVVRNAAAEALTAVYGPRWVWDASFTGALPDPPRPTYSPKRDLIQVRQHHATVGKVIPELKFVFWENLFTRRHDGRLWSRHLLSVLPHLDASQPPNVLRNTVRSEIESVRHIRNRVAHHEPIFARNLAGELQSMRQLVQWRSTEAAAWFDDMESVTDLLNARP